MRKLIAISLGLTISIALVSVGGLAWQRSRSKHQTPEAVHDPVPIVANSTVSTIPLDLTTGNQNGQPLTPGSSAGVDANNPPTNEQYATYAKITSPQYIDLRMGAGAVATAAKPVTINYRGWLTSGQLIDDSYIKGRAPFAFTPGEHKIISGIEAGVIGMKVGGKRRLLLTPDVGYGNQGVGVVPANSILIFDLELLDAK